MFVRPAFPPASRPGGAMIAVTVTGAWNTLWAEMGEIREAAMSKNSTQATVRQRLVAVLLVATGVLLLGANIWN